MRSSGLNGLVVGAILFGAVNIAHGAPLSWATVVNNGDSMPDTTRTFNSYNQPSVNADGLVVLRARSRGGQGNPPVHGIYTRDMGIPNSPILRIADRSTVVPYPNNQGSTFIEFPSFPRIDKGSDTIATRGNHPPVWQFSIDGVETRAGTSGIYMNPGGSLITGMSKLGAVPGFEFFSVPDAPPNTPFDVFPGAPSVTDFATLVFKGNYTDVVNGAAVARTGVYFRDLEATPAGGTSAVELIANSASTPIPGTDLLFGSTAPPSAVGREAVFAGFDDEENPTAGGIYLAPLVPSPPLAPLVSIGDAVPDWRGVNTGETFTRFGEGLSFEGRFVAFWGAAGTQTRPVVVHCPTEGNQLRIDFCLQQCPEPAGCTFDVPVNQGIFVHDTRTGVTRMAARTGAEFDDFLFWNFSGRVPGTDEGDDGEPARFRSSAFVAVDGPMGATFQVAFKASKPGGIEGIYLAQGPGACLLEHGVVLETTMAGTVVDSEAPIGSTISALGHERDGFRDGWLALNARMEVEGGSEEEGWAGIYVTRVPRRLCSP